MISTNSNSKNNFRNKNFQSTGNLFLDKIVDGISLGSVVLLVQDSPTDIYMNFVKYFISEGVVNEQKTFFYYSDERYLNEIVSNLPYKSTQVEAILNSKRVNEAKSNISNTSNTSNNSEMKIAWRYENIKYSNLLEDLVKTHSYIFDLSRQLQDTYLIEKNKDIITSRKIESESNNPIDILDQFNSYITKDYQNYASGFTEEESKLVRIVFPDLFSNISTISDIEITKKEMKLRMNILRNLTRSINGIVFLTINKEFLDKDLFNIMFYFSDYVFSLKSFLLSSERLEDYDALFYVQKLPRLLSFKTIDMETDTYGVIQDKRKVIIEKIDIGVEVDRNTKVKEKDITTSQAICGPEKYSKDYEF
jgi:hypothetical protein